MTAPTWMLYGATGYTGRLLAEEAVARGHRPLLAGRSAAALEPLAASLGLPWRAFTLDSTDALRDALQGVSLVLHAAGPFMRTSPPMVAACLEAGKHYLDITGELPVFQAVFEQDAAARAHEVCLLPGVGFDVVLSPRAWGAR